MSTLESSYQAASQVFTLLNTIMASALNLGDQTTVSLSSYSAAQSLRG